MKITCVLGLISLIASVTALSRNANSILSFQFSTRAFEANFGKSGMVNLLIFLSIPITYFLLILRRNISMIFIGGFIFISAIAFFVWGIKGNVFMLLLTIMILRGDLHKTSLITICVVFLSVPLLFVSMMFFRFGIAVNAETVPYMLMKLVGYVSYNFSNLQSYVDAKQEFAYGLGLLLAIPCLIISGTHWCADIELGVNRSKPYFAYADPSYNIETGLGKLYVEFGYTTFVIFPIFAAFLQFYLFSTRYKNLSHHGAYVFCSAAFTLHFFDFRLIHPVTIFSLFVVIMMPGVARFFKAYNRLQSVHDTK